MYEYFDLNIIKKEALENMQRDNPITVFSSKHKMEILNPWYNISGRFPLNDEAAEAEYGKELIDTFIAKVRDSLERETVEGPIERQGVVDTEVNINRLISFIENCPDIERPSEDLIPISDYNAIGFDDYYWVRPKTEAAYKNLMELLEKAFANEYLDLTFHPEKIEIGKWSCIKISGEELDIFTFEENVTAAQKFFNVLGYAFEGLNQVQKL